MAPRHPLLSISWPSTLVTPCPTMVCRCTQFQFQHVAQKKICLCADWTWNDSIGAFE